MNLLMLVLCLLSVSSTLMALEPVTFHLRERLPEGTPIEGKLDISFENGFVVVRQSRRSSFGFLRTDFAVEPATKVPKIMLISSGNQNTLPTIIQLRTEALMLDGEQRFFIGKPAVDLDLHVEYVPEDGVLIENPKGPVRLVDATKLAALDIAPMNLANFGTFSVNIKDEATKKIAKLDGYFVISEKAKNLVAQKPGPSLRMEYAETDLALGGSLEVKGYFEFVLDGNQLHIKHFERQLLGFLLDSDKVEFQPTTIDDLPLLIGLQIDGLEVVLNPGDFVGQKSVTYTLPVAPSQIKVAANGKGIIFYRNIFGDHLPELRSSDVPLKSDNPASSLSGTMLLQADHMSTQIANACRTDKNCLSRFFYTDYSQIPVRSGEFLMKWIDSETLEIQHVSFSDFNFIAGTKYSKEAGAPEFPLVFNIGHSGTSLSTEVTLLPDHFVENGSARVRFQAFGPGGELEIHISKPPENVVFNNLVGSAFRPEQQRLAALDLGCSEEFVGAPK